MERNKRSLLIQHPLSRLICEIGLLLVHVLYSPNSQLLTPTSLHIIVLSPPMITPRSWGRLFMIHQWKVRLQTNRHSPRARNNLLLPINNSSRNSSNRSIRLLFTHQRAVLHPPVRALSFRLMPSSRRSNNHHILHQPFPCPTSRLPLTSLLLFPQLVRSLRLIRL